MHLSSPGQKQPSPVLSGAKKGKGEPGFVRVIALAPTPVYRRRPVVEQVYWFFIKAFI